MSKKVLRPGDFSGLSKDYSNYRPDYSSKVLRALMGLINKPKHDVDFVDVGAGTGIWTRMVYEFGVRNIIAIEPNDDMRLEGEAASRGKDIQWISGSAEVTGLASESADWLTMASSFHWADFEKALKEFHRALRPGGYFTALWNPRLVNVNPLLVEIESYLTSLMPDMKRVSSGRSAFTETLSERLSESPYFGAAVYIEGKHEIEMKPERYLGAWRSVNDVQVQLGPERFDKFISFVEKMVSQEEIIVATYLTRAWSVQRQA